MTIAEMAPLLGMHAEGHVLYVHASRERRAPARRAEHRACEWGADWWLGRDVFGATVVEADDSTRSLVLSTGRTVSMTDAWKSYR